MRPPKRKRQQYYSRYNASAKGQATRKRYRQTARGKAKETEWMRRCRANKKLKQRYVNALVWRLQVCEVLAGGLPLIDDLFPCGAAG
jgi:hypothetical protein